jgi:hypothetical protein
MKMRSLAVMVTAWLAIGIGSLCYAHPGAKNGRDSGKTDDTPEEAVACTGWHALCSASPDCRMNGDKADCDCLRVNEPHIVQTSEIQDPVVKRQTLAKCTKEHPCTVDEAPVCQAIRDGKYTVDHIRYNWVSTFSYRGWCGLSGQNKPIACNPQEPGYSGDKYWAICDAAPCTENPNPADPNKPLTCQCRVQTGPFLGFGSCTGTNGGIMSSSPQWIWDFQKNTFSVPVPGADYVLSACAPLKSDPFPTK